MAEKTKGAYALVTIPALYVFLQDLLGGVSARAALKREFFPDLAGLTVLEVGCGPGTWFEQLKDAADYTGMDWNGEHIAEANERYSDDNVRFLCGDITTDLAEDANRFDRAFAFGILHHLDGEGATRVLESIHGMLKPGGQMISIDPVYHDNQHWFARWLKSRDSGQNIRTEAEYVALVKPRFRETTATTVTGKLRVPYSHCIVSATRRDEAKP